MMVCITGDCDPNYGIVSPSGGADRDCQNVELTALKNDGDLR
jgi:hypothetical protein